MRQIFALAGVDYQQWRALTRAYVWIDYAAMFGAYGPDETRRTALRFAIMWGVLSLMGLGLAVTVWLARDPFLAAFILITSTALWTGLIVVAQPANLAAPDDHDILGYRPVDSRTLFAVRVSGLLLPVLETTVMIGWLPVLAFLTRTDGSLVMGASAALAVIASSACATLAIVVLFGWLIRIISPHKLTRMLAYASGAAGLALSAGVMLGVNYLAEGNAAAVLWEATIPRDLRTMWFPAAWFASYVALASGSRGTAEIAGAVLSLTALAAIALALRGRISAEYATRVTELATLPQPRAQAPAQRWRLLRDESRAVVLLITSHLRSDVRFQLAMASTVAMGGLFSVVMSSNWSLPVDPFEAAGPNHGSMAPLFALLFVPTQMYHALVVSASYEASWIFYSTPADRVAVVTAARDAIGAFVIAPVTVLLALLYLYAFAHLGHALLQAASLGLMGYAGFQLNVLLAPRLPFSMPVAGDRTRTLPVFTSLLVMLFGTPIFLLFQLIAYRGAISTLAAIGALILLNGGLAVLTRRRLPAKLANQGYAQI